MNTGRWTTLVTTILLVAAVGAAVVWLRATAPGSPTDTSVEVPVGLDALTCDELEHEEAAAASQPDPDHASGRAVSGEVLSCPFAFDGLLVVYVGEVVGDVLARDGGSWMLVNDDPYALEEGPLTAGGTPRGANSGLTVWLPDPLDEVADEPGRADVRGDVLAITGRIHRTDPADGGGLTIRADEVEVLAEAVTIDEPVHWRQVVVAAVLSVLALFALWRERERRDR